MAIAVAPSATAHHIPRPAQMSMGNTPFTAYSTSGNRVGDTCAAHSLGGTMASIARATMHPVASHPSQFVNGMP